MQNLLARSKGQKVTFKLFYVKLSFLCGMYSRFVLSGLCLKPILCLKVDKSPGHGRLSLYFNIIFSVLNRPLSYVDNGHFLQNLATFSALKGQSRVKPRPYCSTVKLGHTESWALLHN